MAPKYPAIPEPTVESTSLRDAVLSLKQAFEILTGQRGNPEYAAFIGPLPEAAVTPPVSTLPANSITVTPAGNIVATNVQAALVELDNEKVAKAGDTMTGHLSLPITPAAANAVRRDYVDTADLLKVAKAGDTMTNFLTLHADPTTSLHASTKQYVDNSINNSSAGLSTINCSLAVSAAAGALTIALKDAAGNDATATTPINVNFRNSTSTSSVLVPLQITTALSLVVSSGSTLETVNATAFRLWVVMFNDGGTPRLGVIKCHNPATSPVAHTVVSLNEYQLVSSTAEGGAGAADSAGVFYTSVAVTSKAYRIIGFVEWNTSGIATAGTWTTTNLGYVQTFGPGIKKPGDIVSVQYLHSFSSNTTSTTAVDTTCTLTFAMSSAANLLDANIVGQAQIVNTAGTNPNWVGALFIAGTSVRSLLCASFSAAGGNGWLGSLAMRAIAQPNALSPIVKLQHSTNSATNQAISSGGMTVTEIMV